MKNKGAFIVIKPVLPHQDIHLLYLEDVIVHIVRVNCSVIIVEEVVVFNFAR